MLLDPVQKIVIKNKQMSLNVLPETDNKRFYLFQVSFPLFPKAVNNGNG